MCVCLRVCVCVRVCVVQYHVCFFLTTLDLLVTPQRRWRHLTHTQDGRNRAERDLENKENRTSSLGLYGSVSFLITMEEQQGAVKLNHDGSYVSQVIKHSLYSLPKLSSHVQADSDSKQPGACWHWRLRCVWSKLPWNAHHSRAEVGWMRWWAYIGLFLVARGPFV